MYAERDKRSYQPSVSSYFTASFLIDKCMHCEECDEKTWMPLDSLSLLVVQPNFLYAQHVNVNTHYVPKSPIGYDDINFVNFRFSNFFLAQIHLEILYFHRLGLKSFDFLGKCIICLPKVSLKHPFF